MSDALRSTIVDIASSVLLGPLEPAEIITSPPLDTYLTGILWPEGQLLDAMEDDQADGAASDDESEGDATVPGYRLIRPCAIGITFAASLDATLHVSLGSTSRYVMIKQTPAVDGGRPKRTFQRHELGYTLTIAPGEDAQWQQSDFTLADGAAVNDPGVIVHVRRRIRDGQQSVTVTLINGSIETDDTNRDEVCLFQTQVVIKAVDKDGTGAIRARKVLPLRAGDEDARSAALLYRNAVEFAVGHAVAAEWDAPQSRRVASVRTTWLPSAIIKSMDAGGHERVKKFASTHPDVLRAEWLSNESARVDILTGLRAFAERYSDWIVKDLKPRLSEFEGEMADTARLHAPRRLGTRNGSTKDRASRTDVRRPERLAARRRARFRPADY